MYVSARHKNRKGTPASSGRSELCLPRDRPEVLDNHEHADVSSSHRRSRVRIELGVERVDVTNVAREVVQRSPDRKPRQLRRSHKRCDPSPPLCTTLCPPSVHDSQLSPGVSMQLGRLRSERPLSRGWTRKRGPDNQQTANRRSQVNEPNGASHANWTRKRGPDNANSHVHRPVGDLRAADFDHEAVDQQDQQDRIERVQRPLLPRDHVVDDLVGDLRDRLPQHLRAADPTKVLLDIAGRQPLRVQRDHVAPSPSRRR